MKYFNWKIWTITQLCVWIGLSLVSVHDHPKYPMTSSDEYGWGIPLGVAITLSCLALSAYQWGKTQP